MRGTDKQVRWAIGIKHRMLNEIQERMPEFRFLRYTDKAQDASRKIESIREAKWFISNRFLGAKTLVIRMTV